MESFEVNYAVRSYLIWWYLVLPETIGSPKRGELGQNRPRHFYLFLEIWFLDFTLFWKILIDPKSGRTGQNWGQKWPLHFFLRIFVWEFSDFLYKSRRPWAFENTVYENIYFAGNWSKVKPNEIKTEPLSYFIYLKLCQICPKDYLFVFRPLNKSWGNLGLIGPKSASCLHFNPSKEVAKTTCD